MTGLAGAVSRTLAASNGGPGLTARELSELLGSPEPVIRNVLAGLVFRDKIAVCDAVGRFKLGDPARLLDRSRFPSR